MTDMPFIGDALTQDKLGSRCTRPHCILHDARFTNRHSRCAVILMILPIFHLHDYFAREQPVIA